MRRAVSLISLVVLLVACTANAQLKEERGGVAEWPTTCDGAVAKLSTELSQSEKEDLAATARDDLILLHHGFGTGIRNEFGLWGGNLALIESCSGSPNSHPDDVSIIIVERLWGSLQ